MSEATHAAEQLEWFLRKLDAFQEVAALLKKYGSLENATAEATAALKALNDQKETAAVDLKRFMRITTWRRIRFNRLCFCSLFRVPQRHRDRTVDIRRCVCESTPSTPNFVTP